MTDVDLLLVYGTLREGVPTYGGAQLPPVVTVARGLRVPGWLYDVGAYPAAVLDWPALRGERAAGSTIECDLVRVGVGSGAGAGAGAGALEATLEAALAEFDAYEEVAADAETGDPGMYRRVLVDGIPALGGAGLAGAAWIYEWTRPVTGLRPIASGRWG